MANKQNIIEINGRRYDARSGASLDSVVPGRRDHGEVALSAAKPAAAINKPLQEPSLQDVVRAPARVLKAHQPQTATTLMRTGIKKPSASAKSHPRAHGPVTHPVAASKLPAPKISAHTVDPRRHHAAARVPKSTAIQRFSHPAFSSEINVPLAPAAQLAPVRPLLAHHPVQAPKVTTTSELLERALEHAAGHKRPAHTAKPSFSLKKQVTVISLSVVAASLLLGVIASQNLNGLRLQMASAKAGFSAGLPAHTPSGYHLAHLNYEPGSVSATYKSNVRDSRVFSLNEKSSDWDSATLQTDLVAKTDPNFTIDSVGGRTVYLFGNGQAAWVNDGVQYVVDSHGSLSHLQLTDLASNL